MKKVLLIFVLFFTLGSTAVIIDREGNIAFRNDRLGEEHNTTMRRIAAANGIIWPLKSDDQKVIQRDVTKLTVAWLSEVIDAVLGKKKSSK